MYEKILVPLDGSKTAETVLPNAVRLARESKAKVVLITVEPPGSSAGRAGPARGKTTRCRRSNTTSSAAP